MQQASENPGDGWYETPKLDGRGLRAAKRAEAEHRRLKRAARTDKQQLELLFMRGHGHCAEAVRLQRRIYGHAA